MPNTGSSPNGQAPLGLFSFSMLLCKELTPLLVASFTKKTQKGAGLLLQSLEVIASRFTDAESQVGSARRVDRPQQRQWCIAMSIDVMKFLHPAADDPTCLAHKRAS